MAVASADACTVVNGVCGVWWNQEEGKKGISFLGTNERRKELRRLYIRNILTKIFGIGRLERESFFGLLCVVVAVWLPGIC
jgi:hypothetical protein